MNPHVLTTSIIQFLAQQQYQIIILLILIVLLYFLPEKNKVKEIIFQWRNKARFTVYLILLVLFVLLNPFKKNDIATVLCFFLFACFGFILLFISRPLKFDKTRNFFLKKYEQKLEKGYGSSLIAFFDKNTHWYLFSMVSRIEYSYLKAQFLEDSGKYAQAYEELNSIKSKRLFEDERKAINYYKAGLLIFMGDISSTESLLQEIGDTNVTDPRTMVYRYLIFSADADFENAFAYIKKAKSMLASGSFSNKLKAKVYYQYGLSCSFIPNYTESCEYLGRAWECIKQTKDIRDAIPICDDYVQALLQNSGNKNKAETIISELKALIGNSKNNQIVLQYLNLLTRYYRQLGDDKALYKLYVSEYQQLYPTLNATEKEIYKSSMFRMVMNSHFVHSWLDKDISTNSEVYDSLPLQEKINLFHTYYGILSQPEFYSLRKSSPYAELYNLINEYYCVGNAVEDTDQIISSFKPYEINGKAYFMNIKLAILKQKEKFDHIKKSERLYKEFYDMLYKGGMKFDAVYRASMLLLDLYGDPMFIMIMVDGFQMRYYLYMQLMFGSCTSVVNPDGIHVDYTDGTVFFGEQVFIYRDRMNNLLDEITEQFRSFKGHPRKFEMSVLLANIALTLDRFDLAKEFQSFYKNSLLSVDHFASWVKNQIKAADYNILCYETREKLKNKNQS